MIELVMQKPFFPRKKGEKEKNKNKTQKKTLLTLTISAPKSHTTFPTNDCSRAQVLTAYDSNVAKICPKVYEI